MTTYTYPHHELSVITVLYNKLLALGDANPVITNNGTMKVTTTLSEVATDAAVHSLDTGELGQVKSSKISEIENNSDSILEIGAETWVTGAYCELSEEEIDKRITAQQYYTANPSELTASKPYILGTINGSIVSTYNLSDITNLVETMKHRLDYIYLSLVANSDSSCSEMMLRGLIDTATTIPEVNAITDTREQQRL